MKGLAVSQVKVQSFHAHFKRKQCKMFDTPELRALVRSGFFFLKGLQSDSHIPLY